MFASVPPTSAAGAVSTMRRATAVQAVSVCVIASSRSSDSLPDVSQIFCSTCLVSVNIGMPSSFACEAVHHKNVPPARLNVVARISVGSFASVIA